MKAFLLACVIALLAPGSRFAQPLFAQPPFARPHFAVDAGWPGPLPGRWLLGHVTGLAIDRKNRIWVLNRPESITGDEILAGSVAAPPLVVFNRKGKVVAHWPIGRRGENWPHREHSIAIDKSDGSVWISGNGENDGFIVKYSAAGRFLLRIGESGPSKGSNENGQLGRVSGMVVDPERGEIFVADGYSNRRVIVFDAGNGSYKRHWGAYGHAPVDGAVVDRTSQLMQPHGITLARDGTLFVGDRPNNRLQAFTREGRWIADLVQRPETGGGTGGATGSVGSVWDSAMWPKGSETHLLVVDGSNGEVRIIDRATANIAGRFGREGSNRGEFRRPHTIAIDGRGNIYVGEVSTGKPVQRFRLQRNGTQGK